jgi:hypothetical protein
LKHGQKETYHTKRNEAPPEQQYDEFLAPCLHCHKLLERVSKLAACQCAANRVVLKRTDMSFDHEAVIAAQRQQPVLKVQ